MVSVLIIADHLLVRHGLKQIIKEEFRNTYCGEAASHESAVNALVKRAWDLVVLDISLPGQDGLQLLRHIRKQHPGTKILMLSVHSEYQYIRRALTLGASGNITKEARRADLVKALKTVLEGRSYVGKGFTPQPEPESPRAPVAHLDILSSREYEVLLAIVAGKRPNEIAAEMGLSVKTVSTYKRRVLDKTKLHSTADLVRYVNAHIYHQL